MLYSNPMAKEDTLTDEAAKAIAAICLMAAFADGNKSDSEQAQLKQLFESLGDLNSAQIYQHVMLEKTSVKKEAKALKSDALKTYAYEMALSVCEADGNCNQEEVAFLAKLQEALGLPERAVSSAQQEAHAYASIPFVRGDAEQSGAASYTATEEVSDDEIDSLILSAAVLNGGLELLPQALATIAIVPLQLRMVYQIGEAYGYSLDKRHLTEFLAAVGLGMTSQVVEGKVRRVLGGLAQKTAGKGAKRASSSAAGAAMSFASTYALGQVAKSYYGAGRTIDLADLRSSFQSQVAQGRHLYEQSQSEVEARANDINVQNLLNSLKDNFSSWRQKQSGS